MSARERVERRRALKRASTRPPTRLDPGGCRRRTAIAALVVAALSLMLLLAVATWAGGNLRAIQQDDPRRPSSGAEPTSLPATLRRPFTVLLVGVDRRPELEEGVRSDTLILVYVEPSAGWAGMLSIPRDSIVEVPGLGQRKINSAYGHGFTNAAAIYGAGTAPESAGAALAAETVAGFLGLPVDYIAQIDFNGFQRVVDTLGGIKVDVPRPLLDAAYPTDTYGYERIFIPAGLQVMDGATALRYARSRHSSSDFDRSRRQQQVLRAILDEARSRGMLSQAALLPELAHDLEQSVRTTLPLHTIGTLSGLADLAQRLDSRQIVQLSINPADVAVLSEEGSDIYWDPAGVRAQVARLLAGPGQSAEQAGVQVLNGAQVAGLAGRVSEKLAAQGFQTLAPADAPLPAARSALIDYGSNPQTLQRLATTLGLAPDQVFSSPPPGAPPSADAALVLIVGADYPAAWAE